MESTTRQQCPRQYTRLARNHFVCQPAHIEWLVNALNRHWHGTVTNVSSPAQQASERSRRYRYGKVNAIRSITQLSGDDLSVLEENS